MDRAAEMVLQYLLVTYSYGINCRKNRFHVQTIMSTVRQPQPAATLDGYARRFRDLKREFQQLEYFCKGTLLKRMMKCGKIPVRLPPRPGQTPRTLLRVDV